MSGVNKLALGTVQFGLDYGVGNVSGQVTLQMAARILARAYSAGMDTLDTAISYGNSESVLGEAGVANWKVVSKLPPMPEDLVDVDRWTAEQVRSSLERLRVRKLDGLLLHRPGQLLESNGPKLYATLRALKDEGFVNKIGVSVYGVSELEQLHNGYEFDLVQIPLNILDRSFVTSGWVNRLRLEGVEVHTRSVFLQGLLLMPAHKRPSKFLPWANIWCEWESWLADTGLTPLQACLRYVCSLDSVNRVLIGVDNVEQLDQIIDASKGVMSSLPCFAPLQDERLINPANWNQL